MNFNFSVINRKNKLKSLKPSTLNNKSKKSYTDLKNGIRNRKLIVSFKILVILNFLILSAIITLLYLNTENNRIFNKYIFEIDSYISANKYKKAIPVIIIASKKVNTKAQALILLKRSINISRLSDNYMESENIAEIFNNKFKRDIRIKKIYLYALLKNEKTDVFFDNFKYKYLKEDSFTDLLLEAYSIYLENKSLFKINSKIMEFMKNRSLYFNILFNPEDPEKYLELYKIDKNRNYLNNLIILNMLEGNSKNALNYTSERGIRDLLAAFVYLDSLKYSSALEIISLESGKNDRLKMIYADTLMYLKNYKDSRRIYNELLNTEPSFSNIPLFNIIWIDYIETGSINITRLNRLINDFPENNIENILFFIKLKNINSVFAENEIKSENNIIAELLKNNKNNNDNYLNIMWDLYNSFSTNDDFKDYFALYLYRRNIFKDLEILTEKEDFKYHKSYDFFSCLLNIYRNDYVKAEEDLKNYLKYSSSWEILYNISLLEITSNNYFSAAQYLNMLINNNSGNKDLSPSDMSKIYFWNAFSLYKTGKYSEAYRFLNKSISLDRSNLESKILMNHIKSKIVES